MEKVLTGRDVNWGNQTLKTRSKDSFTSNEVMDAYFKGKKDGLEFSQKVLLKQFSANIDSSLKYTAQVVDKLTDLSFKPINAYLRLKSVQHFDVLLTLPEEDILNEDILHIYSFLGKFEKKVHDEMFAINYTLSSHNESFNEQLLALDGFVLKSR